MSALMASLAEHRRDIGVPAGQVATAIGVHPSQVSTWERGVRGLRWPSVLAYAAAVGRRIVVWRDGELAWGEDLPGALPRLRQADGLTQRALARRMCLSPPAVCALEARIRQELATVELATVERYLKALDCELRHLPLREVAA